MHGNFCAMKRVLLSTKSSKHRFSFAGRFWIDGIQGMIFRDVKDEHGLHPVACKCRCPFLALLKCTSGGRSNEARHAKSHWTRLRRETQLWSLIWLRAWRRFNWTVLLSFSTRPATRSGHLLCCQLGSVLLRGSAFYFALEIQKIYFGWAENKHRLWT